MKRKLLALGLSALLIGSLTGCDVSLSTDPSSIEEDTIGAWTMDEDTESAVGWVTALTSEDGCFWLFHATNCAYISLSATRYKDGEAVDTVDFDNLEIGGAGILYVKPELLIDGRSTESADIEESEDSVDADDANDDGIEIFDEDTLDKADLSESIEMAVISQGQEDSDEEDAALEDQDSGLQTLKVTNTGGFQYMLQSQDDSWDNNTEVTILYDEPMEIWALDLTDDGETEDGAAKADTISKTRKNLISGECIILSVEFLSMDGDL